MHSAWPIGSKNTKIRSARAPLFKENDKLIYINIHERIGQIFMAIGMALWDLIGISKLLFITFVLLED